MSYPPPKPLSELKVPPTSIGIAMFDGSASDSAKRKQKRWWRRKPKPAPKQNS